MRQSSTVPFNEAQLLHTFQKIPLRKTLNLVSQSPSKRCMPSTGGALSEPTFSMLYTSEHPPKLPGSQSSPIVPLSLPSPNQAGLSPLVSSSWVLAEWPDVCDKWLGRLSRGTWL